MEDKRLIIQLRDCFTAGYTFPLFCIDKGIKKPLFVAPNSEYEEILWEIYVQFKYDRRFVASFAFIDGETTSMGFSPGGVIGSLNVESLSNIDIKEFDKIIVLTNNPLELDNADVIFFKETLNYFIRRAYAEVPLLHFAQRNPGVKIILLPSPGISNIARNEKFLTERKNSSVIALRKKIAKAKEQNQVIPTPYDCLGYDNDTVYKLLEVVERKVNLDGSVSLADDEFIGIKDDKRMTAYQPEKYENTIYFFGNCVMYGFGVPYDRTVQSYLQKLLNENNFPYRVENMAQCNRLRKQSILYNLNRTPVKSGDIIFVTLFNRFKKYDFFPFWNIRSWIQKQPGFENFFPDTTHMNELGQKVLAQNLFDRLKKNNFFRYKEFNYPIPPPGSQIRHTARKFFFCSKFSAEERT